jgi:2-methylisocitrate lyase-like PEP mutase family enzyme
MEHIASERISWKQAMKKEKPLLMPVAHDGLSAKLIERAGFNALQVGGFAVAGARHGLPDLDLTHYAERHAAVKDIMSATALPILVDGDDGYGDVKNVTHTVRGYWPWASRAWAAVAEREQRDFFILARTEDSVRMKEFLEIVELGHWRGIENDFKE